MRYFITPSQNIVRGVLDGGKVVNAEFYVNKKNDYSTPVQLNQLMKERTNLSLGKTELKELSRPNFADFDIPIDAGKKKVIKKKSISGGEVIDAGKRRKSKPSYAAGELEVVEGGKKKKRVDGGDVSSLEAGKPKRPVKKSDEPEEELEAGKKKSVKKPTKSTSSSKSSKSKSGKKSKSSKRLDIVGGSNDDKDKKTTLADLFKQVSLHLANQTSAIIASGGNPKELIKSDIKFFSKQ